MLECSTFPVQFGNLIIKESQCEVPQDFFQLIGHQYITNHGVADTFYCGSTCNSGDLRLNLSISLFMPLLLLLLC